MDAQKRAIAKALSAELNLDEAALLAQLTPCKLPEHGDIAFPCFSLAKSLRKAPQAIAEDLAEKLAGKGLGAPVAMGPYLNFKIDPAAIAASLLHEIMSEKPYGSSEGGRGQRIVIDYSSPNIAKPFGIGHLRSTVIGAALKRLFELQGYEVIGINHLGDWGTQFGLMIAAWKRWEGTIDPSKGMVDEFYRLYKDINKLKEQDPNIGEEAKGWFRKLEEGDAEARRLWQFFREASLAEFARIYELLGVSFEHYMGESFYEGLMAAPVDRLRAKGLVDEDQGALIIDLEKRHAGLGKVLIRKDDGSTLYFTRDLAAAYHRALEFQPSQIIYVVGMPQQLHFKQLFKVLELAGEPWAKGLVHVGFGHYLGMKTREGNLVFLNEVIEKASAIAQEIAAGLKTREQVELSPAEIAEVGKKIGIGSVIFFDFKARRGKDLEFDWDRILNLKGDTGPYLQWTYARTCGILRKNAADDPTAGRKGRSLAATVDFKLLEGPELLALLKTLSTFPAQVERAVAEYEPSIIASYLLDLAAATNAWVHLNDVIHSPDALRDARALVVEAAKRVLEKGLRILGIPVLERM